MSRQGRKKGGSSVAGPASEEGMQAFSTDPHSEANQIGTGTPSPALDQTTPLGMCVASGTGSYP